MSQMFSIFSPSDLIPFIVCWFASKISWSLFTFCSREATPATTSEEVLWATAETSLIFIEMLSESVFVSSIVATISLTDALWSWLVAAFSLVAVARFRVSAWSLSPSTLSAFFILSTEIMFKTTQPTMRIIVTRIVNLNHLLKSPVKSDTGPSAIMNHG